VTGRHQLRWNRAGDFFRRLGRDVPGDRLGEAIGELSPFVPDGLFAGPACFETGGWTCDRAPPAGGAFATLRQALA